MDGFIDSFLYCLQVKTVKPALKQLQQSIQTITSLHLDDGEYLLCLSTSCLSSQNISFCSFICFVLLEDGLSRFSPLCICTLCLGKNVVSNLLQ